MAYLTLQKGSSANLNNVAVKDGQILVTTDTKKIYLDNGSNRLLLNDYPVTSVNGNTGAIIVQHLQMPGSTKSAWVQEDFIGIACGDQVYSGNAFSIRWSGNQGESPAFVDTYDGWRGYFYGQFNKPTYADVGAQQAGTTLPHFFINNVQEIAKDPKQAQSGWYHMSIGDATVLPTSNHGSVLIENDCGTPYQLFFPDNQLDVYKRFGSSTWNAWQRLNAGYAETASRLATERTFSIADNNGSNVGPTVSFNGSTNTIINLPSTIRATLIGSASDNMIANSAVPDACDFNTITKAGVYRYNSESTYTNPPPSSWGQMLVIHAVGDTIAQMAFDYNGPNVHLRQGNPPECNGSGTWRDWKRIWVESNSITGAVWNDYAEYRESDCQEFGRVLVENGDDTLSISTERLQPFAGVSSDTWGFCQGETDQAKTPIAVAGRVLVYPYRDRNEYKPGDCVCAAPNGTVDIMTAEEEILYPSRIVGTVSCVPNYEEWGSGDREPAKVNGRIWIKVK